MSGTGVNIKIGIIGGSGLDDPDILEERQEKTIDTPYGKPSDVLLTGKIGGVDCVLLARHGRDHSVMPTCINYRANIYALKSLGCTHVLATTACGSLQEHIQPGHIVFLDQFIDRTTKRHQTFYDGAPSSPIGVCHAPMHDPFCELTRKILSEVATELSIKHHKSGTVVTIEGPRFSSRAESKVWRMWGGDVINMSSVPEVVLAKEAGLCYAAIAMATDYDCWRETGETVSVKAVIATFKENVARAIQILRKAIPRIADDSLKDQWVGILKKNQADAIDSVMLSSKHNIEVVEIAGSLL